ncbi:inter-alpha-trypsin inhibitor heavy chain H4-like [Daphnia carinata]|uniref:inter-alpha-trypsin inhibitor heavy chain H4-like n=1 Tax=Daphnia carinata TaxID=120202 RepID=UPI00257C68B9|nr:inter-alpha-trypsin inhibitor heavy chain H4-like [Daphnia carinata]
MAKTFRLSSRLTRYLFIFQLWLILASASPTNKGWLVRRDVEELIERTSEFDQPKEQNIENDLPRIYFMEIVSDIRLRYASTKVTSKVANPADKAQEATFHVVLPETAFISSFLMEIDGKVYKASVKEKEEAQTEYQNAVDAGLSAAQVTANARDANQFTVSVNVEPQAKMLFNLTYEELLTRRRGIYEQVIHVSPGSIVPQMSVRVNIFETLPINKITVPQLRGNDIEQSQDLSENEVAKIIRTNETVVSVVYEPTETQQIQSSKDGLQGQFVVQYDVDRSSIERKGGEIHVVDGYFVHFFAPSTLPALPKHVIFVLDTSGSMAGTRIEQTKQAMNSILDQLREDDLFSVVEFSTSVAEWDLRKPYKGLEPYYYNVQLEETTEVSQNTTQLEESFGLHDDIFAYPVTERSIKRAKEFVKTMDVTSSTNINDALLLALKNSQSVQSRLRLTPIIIFLTDGEPTSGVVDKTEILANVRKGNSDDVVSIFSLAFGTGTDYDFLTKISSQNRGFARKIYEAADATLQLKGFFDEVASPLLNNVRFVYNKDGPVHDVTETNVPNFFKGTEFVVAGRIDPDSKLSASITGTGASGSFLFPDIHPLDDHIVLPIPNNSVAETVPAKKSFSLEKIWAYMTIQDMLKKRQIVDDAKSIAEFNGKALNLSITYGFVTPLTSLVVVKPNSTAATADVRPADGGSSGFHSAAFFAAAPPYYQVGAIPPYLAPEGLPLVELLPGFESHEEFTTTDAELTTESTSLLQYNTSPFSADEWITSFEHNATHVKMPTSNDTLELLWQDELPDTAYGSCYADGVHNVVCKSIWKCSRFMPGSRSLAGPVLNADSACVIENKYVGICCHLGSTFSDPVFTETTLTSEYVTDIALNGDDVVTATDLVL